MSSAPDLTMKVIGYRAWHHDENYNLHSTGFGPQTWGRGVNVARCNQKCDPSPGPVHQCGLYALHDLDDSHSGPGPHLTIEIVGAVTAWGRMEVHYNGFRAQYAEPIALGYNDQWPLGRQELVRGLADSYEIPVVPFEELEEFALGFGGPVPVGLRPDLLELTKVDNFPNGGLIAQIGATAFTSSGSSATTTWTPTFFNPPPSDPPE